MPKDKNSIADMLQETVAYVLALEDERDGLRDRVDHLEALLRDETTPKDTK